MKLILVILVALLVLLVTSPVSGSDDATDGTPGFLFSTITVQRVPEPEVAKGMDYWNLRSGRKDFLVFTDDVAQIRFEPGTWGCLWSGPRPYDYATIYRPSGPQGWTAYAHEIGHAIGFDHYTQGVMGFKFSGPRNRRFDRKLLEQAGYR